MTAEPLFYQRELDPEGEVVLTGGEARHVAVQRLRPGDAVAVFDGRGRVARGRIASLTRDAVRISVERHSAAPSPAPAIHLYCAVPKGDRQAVMLDMATQLGVSRFVPVAWRRSVVEPGPRAQERWQRVCIEACKQSRRLHVPEIRALTPLPDAIATARADRARLLLAHLAPDARPVHALALAHAAPHALFVGPEGGVTDEEAQQLRAGGADLVQLGDGVLRVETAAVALLALVRGALQAAEPAGPTGPQ